MAHHSTTTRNVQRDKLFFRERLCKSGGAPSWVEHVACPVLSRSCFRVDAQQLAATDLDSRVRRSLWISGVNVSEEQYPQVPARKFLEEEERRNTYRHKNPFTSLISVGRDDGLCCVFTLSLNLALFNLIVVINKPALTVFSFTATMESVITSICCTGEFETEHVLLEHRREFGFLLVLWTSCNALCNTSEGPSWWNLSVYERVWRCV